MSQVEDKYAKFTSNWINSHRDFHDYMRRRYGKAIVPLEDFFLRLEDSREFTSAWFKYRWNHQELREVSPRGQTAWWRTNPLLKSVLKQFNIQSKEAPKNGTASTSGRARKKKERFPALAKVAVRDLVDDYCKANNLKRKDVIEAFDELLSLIPLHRTEVMHELNRFLVKLEPYANTPEKKRALEAAKKAAGQKQAGTSGRFAKNESKEVPSEWQGIITQEEWNHPWRTADPVSEFLWRTDIAKKHRENTPVYEKLVFDTSPEESSHGFVAGKFSGRKTIELPVLSNAELNSLVRFAATQDPEVVRQAGEKIVAEAGFVDLTQTVKELQRLLQNKPELGKLVELSQPQSALAGFVRDRRERVPEYWHDVITQEEWSDPRRTQPFQVEAWRQEVAEAYRRRSNDRNFSQVRYMELLRNTQGIAEEKQLQLRELDQQPLVNPVEPISSFISNSSNSLLAEQPVRALPSSSSNAELIGPQFLIFFLGLFSLYRARGY